MNPTTTQPATPVGAIEKPPPAAVGGGRDAARGQSIARRWAVPVFLVCFAFTITSVFMAGYPKLSPYDEPEHLDYVYQMFHGHFVRQNEIVSQYTIRTDSCRGNDSQYVPPPCEPASYHYNPKQFVWAGVNTASAEPPLYYGITALLARPLTWLGFSFFIAARLTGALWLAATLLLVWDCLRRWGLPRPMQAAVPMAMAAMPAMLVACATVSNDAGQVFGGALLAWSFVVLPRRMWAAAAVFGIAFATVWLKSTNEVGLALFGFAILAELLICWNAKDGARIARIAMGVATMAGTILGAFAWIYLSKATVIGVVSASPGSAPLHLGITLDQISLFLPPIQNYVVLGIFSHARFTAIQTIVDWIMLSTCFAIGLQPGRSTARALGIGAAIGAVTTGPLLYVSVALSTGTVPNYLNTRYSFSIVAFMVVVFGYFARSSRAGRILAYGIAITTTASLLYTLIPLA